MFPPSSEVEISPLLAEPKKESRLLVKRLSKQELRVSSTKLDHLMNSQKKSEVKET